MKLFILPTLVTFLFLVFTSFTFAQNVDSKIQTKYLEIVRKDGWEVPGISSKVEKSKKILISEVKVLEEKLKPKPEIPTVLESFSQLEKDELQISSYPVYVYEIYAYSLNNKRFAYKVFSTPRIIENGLRRRVRATITVYFYDEDGDGKYETRYQEMKATKLPKWFQNKN